MSLLCTLLLHLLSQRLFVPKPRGGNLPAQYHLREVDEKPFRVFTPLRPRHRSLRTVPL